MPEELVVITVFALLAGTVTIITVVKSILRYLSSKHQPVTPSSSMTSSELREIIRSAVEDATHPLAERVDRLEQRLDAPGRLEAPARSDLLGGMDEYEPQIVNTPVSERGRAR
ncbi:MAG: hypothetical protein ACE5G0_06350 [Rhodothermales bacterium]